MRLERGARLLKHGIRRDNRCEFTLYVDERHRSHLIRAVPSSIGAGSIERCSGIVNEVRLKAEVGGHSGGSFDAVISCHAGDNNRSHSGIFPIRGRRNPPARR